jgi:hypothetical protein
MKKKNMRKTKKGARKMTKEKEPALSSYPDRGDLDPEIREFLDHFFESKYLQYRILSEYRKIYSENGDFIEKEIARKRTSQEKNITPPGHFD